MLKETLYFLILELYAFLCVFMCFLFVLFLILFFPLFLLVFFPLLFLKRERMCVELCELQVGRIYKGLGDGKLCSESRARENYFKAMVS